LGEGWGEGKFKLSCFGILDECVKRFYAIIEVGVGEWVSVPSINKYPAVANGVLYRCKCLCYSTIVIKSFRHKGLARFFQNDNATGIRADLVKRSRRRLSALDVAERLEDLNVPGFNFHQLQGEPKRYSIHVNGPWTITFEWIDGDAWRIDLEQYH